MGDVKRFSRLNYVFIFLPGDALSTTCWVVLSANLCDTYIINLLSNCSSMDLYVTVTDQNSDKSPHKELTTQTEYEFYWDA